MTTPPRLLSCLLLVSAFAIGAAAQTTTVIPNSQSGFAKTATQVSAADKSQSVDVVIGLASKNAAALKQFTEDVQTPGTASYGQFLTPAAFTKQFGATAKTITAIKKFAAANHLQVEHLAANQLSVILRGTVADVEAAFSTQINSYKLPGGAIQRGNASPLKMDSTVAQNVTAASITDITFEPDHVQVMTASRKALKPVAVSSSPDGLAFTSQCFRSPETITASGGGATATYEGNRYGANINSGPPNLPPCGYDVSDVWSGYDLKPMYEAGLGGQGETIVIVDAYGSTTIKSDANTFSELNGLPALNSTNFKIIGTPTGTATNSYSGWALETTLDVEWAHAIAPHAKIVLEIAPTNYFSDFYNSEEDAILNHRGVVISNSWSTYESFTSPGLRSAFDSLFAEANSIGMDVNFATGDYGDDVVQIGYADVGYPSSSPYVTAIGGTTLALTKEHTMKFQTGWGNNATELVDGSSGDPEDPPQIEGFIYGANGGNSNVYGKPAWQKGTNQTRRALPDVSWLADPFTGVETVITISGAQYFETVGGTSLATPMFSAIWAVANQKANTSIGLGNAAPMLYSLPSGAIYDVVPFSTANNVHGVIGDASGTYQETATELAIPLDYTRGFYSALYQDPSSASWFDITFGTDSTLFTKRGWDNVTGVGTPNGLKFVTDVANKK